MRAWLACVICPAHPDVLRSREPAGSEGGPVSHVQVTVPVYEGEHFGADLHF